MDGMFKKIDELLGIVYGINYDGVINTKELELLSNWGNENCNVENPEIHHAIVLLNNILEDGIITEEERNQLLGFLERYKTEENNVYRSYYVLNGIIQGITSDKVINYDEAIELRKWLKINTGLKGRHVYDRTVELLEEVLEDDYISEYEHDELLQTFQEMSAEYKKHAQIEIIKRSIARQENIGMDIIRLIDSKDIQDAIHYEARQALEKVINSHSGLGEEEGIRIVFLSLAIIALTTYDGAFYPHVEEQFSSLYQKSSSQKINLIIREIIARFRPKSLGSDGRIINYVMMNSLVPKHFLPDFFVFLFDIYKVNFGYTLTDSVYEDLSFVYEGLKDKLSEDTDDLELNVTKKTYKLTKGTKCVIQNDASQNAIIELSKKLLEIIEETYWDDHTPQFENSYYEYGYTEWQRRLEEKESDRARRRSETTRARWTPIFVFRAGEVWLCPPVHNIHGIADYYTINIRVYSGDSVIYEDSNPEIYEIIGGFQVHPKDLNIKEPLSNIRYVLREGDRVIYDSKERLERQFILFDIKGNEIRNNHSYNGSVYIVHNDPDSDLDIVYEDDNYRLSIAHDVDEDTVIYLGDSVISFTEEIKPGIEGEIIPRQFVQMQDKYFPVFSEISTISFESMDRADNIGIQINNKRIRLNDMPYVQRTRSTFSHYQVEVDIKAAGIYDISAFSIRDGKLLNNASFIIALDPDFAVESLQIDDDQYLVDLKSELGKSDCLELDLNGVETIVRPINGRNQCYLHVDPGVAAYRIDSMQWHSFSEPLWIGDIQSTSVLEVKGDEFCSLQIKDAQGNLLDELPLKNPDGICSCQIGSVVSYKAEHDYVILSVQRANGIISKIPCYNKCLLDWDNTHIYNDPVENKVRISASFRGKGSVGCRIVNSNGSTVLESKSLNTDNQLVVTKLRPLAQYYIQYFEITKGFSLKKERELGTLAIHSFSFEDLVGRRFLISRVEFEEYSGKTGALERNEWELVDTYVKFTKHIGNGMFEGRILRKRDGKLWKVRGAEQVEIEYLGEPEEYTVEAAITYEQDGLLLDFDRDTIHMNYDDPKAVDIYSYTIKLKGDNDE